MITPFHPAGCFMSPHISHEGINLTQTPQTGTDNCAEIPFGVKSVKFCAFCVQPIISVQKNMFNLSNQLTKNLRRSVRFVEEKQYNLV